MELKFSVTGGALYSDDPYVWFGDDLTIVGDPGASDNEDLHQVIVTTGRIAVANYNLKVKAPDGSVVTIPITTSEQDLTLMVKPVEDQVIDESVIYVSGLEIDLVATGGLGVDSYEFSISASDPWDQGSLLNNGDGTATYTLPSATVSVETAISFLVQSRNDLGELDSDQGKTELTIYPSLSMTVSESELVDGAGGIVTATVQGGTGLSTGYSFSTTSTDVELTQSESALDVLSIAMTENPSLNDDLNAPVQAVVQATDLIFTSETVSTTISLFPGPSIEYKIPGNTGEFTALETGLTFEDVSGNAFVLSILGGNGTTSVTLNNVVGYTSLNEESVLTESNSDNVVTASAANINVGETLTVNNLDGAYLSLFPGDANGSVTIETSSKGSTNTFVINFASTLVVDHTKVDGTASGELESTEKIYLRARNSNSAVAEKTMVSLGVTNSSGNTTWTYNGPSGGFVSAAEYATFASSANVTISTPTTFADSALQRSNSDLVYFVSGISTGTYTLQAVAADGKSRSITVQFTANDPMYWTEEPEPDANGEFSYRSRISYTFGDGTPPFTVQTVGFDEAVTVRADGEEGSSITIPVADDGEDQIRSFFLDPNRSESTGQVRVTDADGVTLESVSVTFSQSATVTTTTISGSPITTASSVNGSGGGGGGGGCLLR
jgi:hypothetical protein